MINLDDYKPLIDTTILSDDELELWYGSKFAIRFLRLIEGCKIKVDFERYPNSIFYFKDGEYLMDYDLKTEYFWISSSKIWAKSQSEFGYNNEYVRELITGIVKQHFKCKVVRTTRIIFKRHEGLNNHFKNN